MPVSFPANPQVNDTFESNNKTWQWNGTSWSLVSVPQVITDATITAAKLASGSVTEAKIDTGAVTAGKIGALAVTSGKIDSNAVTSGKLASGAVTHDKLHSSLSAVTICTSSTRPASPFTGQTAYETDTKALIIWDGATWIYVGIRPPDAPTSLSAIQTNTSVTISFTAGAENGAAISNYQYAISTNGGVSFGSYTAFSPADASSPVTISGLNQNTAYQIKLKAVNSSGASPESSAVSFTTYGTPPTAPTSLTAGSITSSSVAISFTAPSDTGGVSLTNYEYALSTNGGSSYGSYTALSPADSTSPITISGLSMGTAYNVKLKAVNTYGSGVESAAVSFTTLSEIAVQYLVIAGGGGGGNRAGGGGGAGGYRNNVTGESSGGGAAVEAALTITGNTTYAITVGAGGSAQANGSNSVFHTITSTGGGRGGNASGGYDCGEGGQNGGSGGGGAMFCAGGGSGVSGQGTSGGTGGGVFGQTGFGGGGGGAGSAGSGKNGGSGRASSINGSSVTRAGGGAGDGVNEASGSQPVSGANTGSGGPGNFGGGNSGVVIIRYLTSAKGSMTITGGTVTTSGSYTVHTFNSSSNLVLA